jgi:hypothetical protein
LEDWMKIIALGAAAAGLVAAAMLAASCGGSADTSTEKSSADDALSLAFASVIQSSGTLVCSPSQSQIDLCSGLKAGDACTLTSTGGSKTFAGTCRATLDGASIGCAPNPPAPPKELADPCAGKAAGAACQVQEAIGNARDGVCAATLDGSTLICGRVVEPPKAIVDACAKLEAGATCTLSSSAAGKDPLTGVCSHGPAGSGALACLPAQELNPPWQKVCDGKESGADCTLGRAPFAVSGKCEVPAAGGAAVCVLPCMSLGGSFDCGHRGDAGLPNFPGHSDGGHGVFPHPDGGFPGHSDGGHGAIPHPDGGFPGDHDGGHGAFPHLDGGAPVPPHGDAG